MSPTPTLRAFVERLAANEICSDATKEHECHRGLYCVTHLSNHIVTEARAVLAGAETRSGRREDALRDALKDAIQVASNYYMLFHDETWKARLVKWEAALVSGEAPQEPMAWFPEVTREEYLQIIHHWKDRAIAAEEKLAAPGAAGGVTSTETLQEACGLSLDMLDVDRLREWARLLLVHGADISHWGSVPFVASKMQTLATDIEKAVRDIGTLRKLAGGVTSGAETEETPCPKREDQQHCNCWYDGKACCACGDDPAKMANLWRDLAQAEHEIRTIALVEWGVAGSRRDALLRWAQIIREVLSKQAGGVTSGAETQGRLRAIRQWMREGRAVAWDDAMWMLEQLEASGDAGIAPSGTKEKETE